MEKSFLVVTVTASSKKEAKKIAKAILQDKLAACVQILPRIQSRYWWKGKIESEEESLLCIKTMASKFDLLRKKIEKIHSYSVPEVIATPIVAGNPNYLKWIEDSIQSTSKEISHG